MKGHALRRPFRAFDPHDEACLLPLGHARQLGLMAAQKMPTLPGECVMLEAACGRVLADPVSNHEPLPRYDAATMDGYAIRRGDLIGPRPWTLRVDGHLAAGAKKSERPPCGPGGALSVATGAHIFGALDAVIPHEIVERSDGSITVFQCPSRNANIHSRGQDAKVGTDLLPAGHVLNPRDIALLAGLGRAEILVRKKLRVACLSTGSELVEIGTKLGRGQNHDCNRPMLKAALNRDWITYLDLGVIRDDMQALCAALPVAASAADVIIVTGGASGGVDTTMSDAMAVMEGEIVARNIAMDPGKPLMLATLKGAFCICLPGNPVSASIALDVLGWDLLQARAGIDDVMAEPEAGIAAVRISGRSGRAEFPLVKVTGTGPHGEAIVATLPGNNPSNLRRLAEADGFAHLGVEESEIEKGSRLLWTRF